MRQLYLNKIKGINNLFKSDTQIIIAKNEYHIYLEETQIQTYYPSNNDGGEKRIAFYLKNLHNLILDFSESKLIFHGRIHPFIIDGCSDIIIKNFTVDYDRPFYSQGIIEKFDKGSILIDIDKTKYPYYIKNQDLIFTAPTWENNLNRGINLFMEFDLKSKAPAYNCILKIAVIGKDAIVDELSPLPEDIYLAEELNGKLLLKGDFSYCRKVGNIMVITHEKRDNNIVFALNSNNLQFDNIEVIHGGAMGIICQTCTNILIDKFICRIKEDNQGLITLNCDATHFVNCDGKIIIKNCIFENMMDDAVNIHGIYTVVSKVENNRLIVDLKHFQQFNVNIYRTGDEITVYSQKTVHIKNKIKIKEVKFLSEKQLEILTLDDTSNINEGDCIDNAQRMPEVEITGCKSGRNRPRGFLISSPKKIVIKENEFYNSCFGLHFAGDNNFWYESGGVQNVLIEKNIFRNCGYHYGEYSIAFLPEYTKNNNDEFSHNNIVIKNNIFETFTGGVFIAKGTKNLSYINNEVKMTKEYPFRGTTEMFSIEDCKDIEIK
jgi:hypothetical protein